ncbi:hypothetical protein Emag_002647 [Eimeria magna]
MDPKSISDSIIRQVEFLESRDRSAAFAMAASMYNLPGELCSTYIYLLLCQKVTERERRRILAAKEQEGRELGQRRARAKRMNYNKRRQQSGKHKTDDQEEEAGKEQEQPVEDEGGQPSEGLGANRPEDEGAPLATVEVPEDAAPAKQKKKKAKIPKVKKRAPNLSPQSEVAFFEISRNYYAEEEAPDFKTLMQDLEDSIAEVLHVSPMRIRGFQGRYYEKRLVFAIQPDLSAEGISDEQARDCHEQSGHEGGGDDEPHKNAGALSPSFLMEALKQLVGKMLSENDVFAEITGGKATLIWDGPGSRPYCKEEKDEPSDGGSVIVAHFEHGGSRAVGELTGEETGKKKKKKKKVKKRSTEIEGAPPAMQEPRETPETPPSLPAEAPSASAAPAAAAAGAALAVAVATGAVGEGVRQKKGKKTKKEKPKLAETGAEPEPPPTPPTKDTAPSPASPVIQPTSSPPSSSSSSSSDERPSPLSSPHKPCGVRVAAAGAVARAVTRLKSHRNAPFSSSSSSSETDSQTQAAERQIRQRLEDLTRLRHQLQQKQDTGAETDSLSSALSSDAYVLNSNAEVRYLSEDDSHEESDWEEEEAATRELKEKIEILTQRKQELEALKATLAETKDQMKYSQFATHATERNPDGRCDSPLSSVVSLGPYVPSPPPLSSKSCISRQPQPPAIARSALAGDRNATAASSSEPLYPVEHLYSALLPARQAHPQKLRFVPRSSASKHVRRRRPSWSSESEPDKAPGHLQGLEVGGLHFDGESSEDACTIGRGPLKDAAGPHKDSTGRLVSQEVSETQGSGTLSTPVAEAVAVMLRQQGMLRQRLHEAQRQKLQLQQQQRRQHAASGYAGRPTDYAYQRIKRQRNAQGTGETDDLLRGFFSPLSSSGESEY